MLSRRSQRAPRLVPVTGPRFLAGRLGQDALAKGDAVAPHRARACHTPEPPPNRPYATPPRGCSPQGGCVGLISLRWLPGPDGDANFGSGALSVRLIGRAGRKGDLGKSSNTHAPAESPGRRKEQVDEFLCEGLGAQCEDEVPGWSGGDLVGSNEWLQPLRQWAQSRAFHTTRVGSEGATLQPVVQVGKRGGSHQTRASDDRPPTDRE